MNRKSKFADKCFTKYIVGSALLVIAGISNAQEQEAEHETEHSPHHWQLFAGPGIEKDHGHEATGSVIGFKYDYQFHERWSVGLAAEKLIGDGTERATVVGAALSFHATDSWRLFTGPGYEYHKENDRALLRVGVAYHWELKNGWSLAPEVFADYLEGGAKVYVGGISIGHPF